MPDLLVLVLATAYWAMVLPNDKYAGPFGVLRFLRNAAFKRNGKRVYWHGGLLHCDVCTSVWVALVLSLLWANGWQWPTVASAAAGGYVLLLSIVESVRERLYAETMYRQACAEKVVSEMNK